MHKTELPQFAIDGVMRRRGRLHTFESIEPQKTALVVIDMQNVFMQPSAPAEVPVAREIVPNINRLAESVRQHGGVVAWVQMTHGEQTKVDWSVFYGGMNKTDRAERIFEWLKEGGEGQKLWPGMDVQDGDIVATKDRYSAFLHGASDLPETLTERGFDTVIITGTLTNVCCESSARDAMMRNYKTIMISDGNAASTDEEHTATLASIIQVFGDVFTTDEMIQLIETSAAGDKISTAAE